MEEVVTRKGPAVIVPDGSELFRLDLAPGNPAAAISVMDYRFLRIFSNTGELHEREIPGVYKVRVEFGRDITMASDEVLLLDRDTPAGPVPAPKLPSPAPIPGTASTHEFHVTPFEQAADRRGAFTGPAAGRSAISVLARYWTEPGSAATAAVNAAPPPHPMQGLQLIDAAGRPVADLPLDSPVESQTEVDPVAVWEREVPRGAYFLRQVLPGGRQYEGCVIVSPEWVTQVVIQRTAQISGAPEQPETIDDVAVFMRRAGVTRTPDEDAVIEGARLALAQGRNLFAEGRGAQLAELLVAKFTDPIAGIIGGHLLLRAMGEGEPDPHRTEQFHTVVTNLRSLVGPDHPDVEALSLRCTDVALRNTRPVTAPPMFRHSWQLVAEASYERPELIPIELWQRVHASVTLGAFFVWAIDEQTRTAHDEQMSRWISQYDAAAPMAAPAAPRTAARTAVSMAAPAAVSMAAPAAVSSHQRFRRAVRSVPLLRRRSLPPVPLMTASVAEPATQLTPLPGAAREAAYRMHVPADAAAVLWAEREVPERERGWQADV